VVDGPRHILQGGGGTEASTDATRTGAPQACPLWTLRSAPPQLALTSATSLRSIILSRPSTRPPPRCSGCAGRLASASCTTASVSPGPRNCPTAPPLMRMRATLIGSGLPAPRPPAAAAAPASASPPDAAAAPPLPPEPPSGSMNACAWPLPGAGAAGLPSAATAPPPPALSPPLLVVDAGRTAMPTVPPVAPSALPACCGEIPYVPPVSDRAMPAPAAVAGRVPPAAAGAGSIPAPAPAPAPVPAPAATSAAAASGARATPSPPAVAASCAESPTICTRPW